MFLLLTLLSPRLTRGLLPPHLDLTLPLPSAPNPGSGHKHTTATTPSPRDPERLPATATIPVGARVPLTQPQPTASLPQQQALIQTSSTASLLATPRKQPLSRESPCPLAGHLHTSRESRTTPINPSSSSLAPAALPFPVF